MSRDSFRRLCAILAALILASSANLANAEDPVLFVTSFAAGEQGAIQSYQLELETGKLKPLQRTTGVENPFFTALSPDRKFLYSIHARQFGGKDHEQVAAYAISGPQGELKLLNRQSARGTAACYLQVDATGKALLVANYSTGSVASLPIQPDGSLGEAVSFFQHAGSSIDPSRQQGPHAHCIVASPDNRFAYAADLGLDQIVAYTLDASAAKLSPARQPFVRCPPGAGPRHLIFHPNHKWMYVINELSNSVTAFEYVAESGMLIEKQTISTLPPDFDGKSYCADLKITPDGRFLYGTNRGHDSIAAYRIGADGQLTLLGIEPSLGNGPQNLAITAGGELLLCANMPGNNVSVFRINSETGGLESIGSPVAVTMPSCIAWLRQ